MPYSKILSEIVKTALNILEFEYKNYRAGKIKNKERFKQANIKMRIILRNCLTRLNLTKAHNIYIGEKLANVVPEIALDLDKIAIETQDVFPVEVILCTDDECPGFSGFIIKLDGDGVVANH